MYGLLKLRLVKLVRPAKGEKFVAWLPPIDRCVKFTSPARGEISSTVLSPRPRDKESRSISPASGSRLSMGLADILMVLRVASPARGDRSVIFVFVIPMLSSATM